MAEIAGVTFGSWIGYACHSCHLRGGAGFGRRPAARLPFSAAGTRHAFESLAEEHGGLLSDADLMAAGDELEPGSSAALLVWEDVWAARFAQALENAGAELVTIQRIPRDIVKAALEFAAAETAGATA